MTISYGCNYILTQTFRSANPLTLPLLLISTMAVQSDWISASGIMSSGAWMLRSRQVLCALRGSAIFYGALFAMCADPRSCADPGRVQSALRLTGAVGLTLAWFGVSLSFLATSLTYGLGRKIGLFWSLNLALPILGARHIYEVCISTLGLCCERETGICRTWLRALFTVLVMTVLVIGTSLQETPNAGRPAPHGCALDLDNAEEKTTSLP